MWASACFCLAHGWPTEVFLLNFQLHTSLSQTLLLLAARTKWNSWGCETQHTPSVMFPILWLRLERRDRMGQSFPFITYSIMYSDYNIACVRKSLWMALKGFLWLTLYVCTLMVVRKQFRPTIFANFPMEPLISHTWCLVDNWDYMRKCPACLSMCSTQQI